MSLVKRAEAQPKAEVAMMLFLLSETVFFVMLGIAYVISRDAPPWPAAKRPLDALTTGVYTVSLVASSGTWWLAERDARRNRRVAQRVWMGVTIALGAVFLIGQVHDYLVLMAEHITIAEAGLFGTTFYTLTGFHGLHVSAGLIMLVILFVLALTGREAWAPQRALTTVGYYWHYVDVVWIVIYSLVYLWR